MTAKELSRRVIEAQVAYTETLWKFGLRSTITQAAAERMKAAQAAYREAVRQQASKEEGGA